MSNLVIDRIARQNQVRKPITRPFNFQFVPDKIVVSPPIPLDKLKKIFMEELVNKEVVEAKPEESPVSSEKIFNGIDDFVVWYLGERDKQMFSDNQRIALNTLVDARNVVYTGCKCNRDKLKNEAEKYFKVFWMKNQYTDLPQRIREILKTPYKFSVNAEIFLIVP